MHYLRSVAVLLTGLIPFLIQAQPAKPFWFHELKEANGISIDKVRHIFQDSEGFTWIAADNGLKRFDGRTLKPYLANLHDSTALKENYITGNFFEDSQKDLWFCTNSYIHRYNRASDNFSHFRIRDRRGLLIQDGYFAIHLERDSFLWLRAGNKQIFRFNIGNLIQSHTPLGQTKLDILIFPGAAPNAPLRYLFSVDGAKSPGLELFLYDSTGRLLEQQMCFDGMDSRFPPFHIHSVHYEQDTAVWLSSNSGIIKWNLLSDEIRISPTRLTNTKIIAVEDDETFIVSEREIGLYRFYKRSGMYTRLPARIVGNQDFDLESFAKTPYIDPLENLWLNLDGEGLVYTALNKVKVDFIPKMKMFNGVTNYQFRTILQGRDHKIWCSTFFDGIFLLDSLGRVIHHYHPENRPTDSLIHKQANHLLLDRDENLWVGMPVGVALKRNRSEKFELIVNEQGKPVPNVVFLYQLITGEILASTVQDGIYLLYRKGQDWRLKQILPQLEGNDFLYPIYQDKLGSIYISHKMIEILVFNFLDGKLKQLTNLPVPGFINGFYEDEGNNLIWIASSSGLVSIDKTNLQQAPYFHAEKNELTSKKIQAIVPYKNKHIWLTTDNQLMRFEKSSQTFTSFTLADGIGSTIFYEFAALNHSDGSIWFGGNNGIAIVKPDKIESYSLPPRIRLTEIMINDEMPAELSDEVSGATNIRLIRKLKRGYRDNTLSFYFVAIDYSDPTAVQLEYFMEGKDKNWVLLKKGETGFARYSNLAPGHYTFKVRAYNSDGVPTDVSDLLDVSITPPWYQTWWFYTLLALMVLTLLYAYYRFRIGQIRKEEAYKRKEAEFRQKEAEYKQLAAETETAVLRLQMNPHFIFNSMNSINSYILQRDVDTASHYLARFSKLMRMILNHSAKPLIAIADEIELLEQYLKTEAMRFEKKFSYTIEVDEELDPDDTLVPTMILQPFVENAVWHGLSPKGAEGAIGIKFVKDNGSLRCTVEDNGVGRPQRAKVLQHQSSHQSKAIAITERRLQLLKNGEDQTASLQIIDLLDDQGAPAGTRVIIRLPWL